MLQAHSPLWHYLWVAPNLLLLTLGGLIWRRRLIKSFPAFFAFAIGSAVSELAVYGADIIPSVSPYSFWRVVWITLLLESILKFVLIAEIFATVFGSYEALAKLGKNLIRLVGIALVLGSALVAAYTPKDGQFEIISGAHLLEQTFYLIECGLLAFIFLFGSYFHLHWNRPIFGIGLGLAISACVHLGNWALVANAGLPNSTRYHLDFISMATYHFCVLIWFYYLLVPGRVVAKSAVPLPENNLAVWNRELERLLQQ